MSSFEDRLWTDLVREHGAALTAARRSAPQRKRARPLLLSGSVALAATIAVVVLAVTASDTTPAFAVIVNQDRTVTVTVRQLSDRPQVNRKLRSLGVRARIVPLSPSCRYALHTGGPGQPVTPATEPLSGSNLGPIGAWKVVIIPNRIPLGHTLVLAPRRISNGYEMADATVRGPGPSCSSPEYTQGGEVANPTPSATSTGSSTTTSSTSTTAYPTTSTDHNDTKVIRLFAA